MTLIRPFVFAITFAGTFSLPPPASHHDGWTGLLVHEIPSRGTGIFSGSCVTLWDHTFFWHSPPFFFIIIIHSIERGKSGNAAKGQPWTRMCFSAYFYNSAMAFAHWHGVWISLTRVLIDFRGGSNAVALNKSDHFKVQLHSRCEITRHPVDSNKRYLFIPPLTAWLYCVKTQACGWPKTRRSQRAEPALGWGRCL